MPGWLRSGSSSIGKRGSRTLPGGTDRTRSQALTRDRTAVAAAFTGISFSLVALATGQTPNGSPQSLSSSQRLSFSVTRPTTIVAVVVLRGPVQLRFHSRLQVGV